jgi:hypothetical protein
MHEEPSVEGIIACLRRILVAEEVGRMRAAAPGAEPLFLSDMIVGDGSIVKISPGRQALPQETSPVRLRDPFIRLDMLKGRVAVLLSPEYPGTAPRHVSRRGWRAATPAATAREAGTSPERCPASAARAQTGRRGPSRNVAWV